MSLPACPRCGFNKKASLLSGSHFSIYRCDSCKTRFCYECRGSNGGRKCPDCGSTSKQSVDTVYLR